MLTDLRYSRRGVVPRVIYRSRRRAEGRRVSRGGKGRARRLTRRER